MKPHLITGFFILFSFTTFSQRIKKSDLEIEKVISYKTDSSSIKTYFTDKTVHPQDDTEYYWMRLRKIQYSTGNYSGKLLDGVYEVFYHNGQLQEKGEFRKGTKTGHWLTWNKKGEITTSVHYRKGKLNGRFYKTIRDTIITGKYSNGLLNGKIITLVNKQPIDTLFYKKGKLYLPKVKSKKPNREKLKPIALKEVNPDSTEVKPDTAGFFKHFFSKRNSDQANQEKEKEEKKSHWWQNTFNKKAKESPSQKKEKSSFFSRLFKRTKKDK